MCFLIWIAEESREQREREGGRAKVFLSLSVIVPNAEMCPSYCMLLTCRSSLVLTMRCIEMRCQLVCAQRLTQHGDLALTASKNVKSTEERRQHSNGQ